jgi:hypothetical protein
MKNISSRRRSRQVASNPLLPNSLQPPRAVRAVYAVERGLVLAIGSSVAEIRRLLNAGGAA